MGIKNKFNVQEDGSNFDNNYLEKNLKYFFKNIEFFKTLRSLFANDVVRALSYY